MDRTSFMDGDYAIYTDYEGHKTIVQYKSEFGVFVDKKGAQLCSIKNTMHISPVPMSVTYLKMIGFKKVKNSVHKLKDTNICLKRFPNGWFVTTPQADIAIGRVTAIHQLQHILDGLGVDIEIKIR